MFYYFTIQPETNLPLILVKLDYPPYSLIYLKQGHFLLFLGLTY